MKNQIIESFQQNIRLFSVQINGCRLYGEIVFYVYPFRGRATELSKLSEDEKDWSLWSHQTPIASNMQALHIPYELPGTHSIGPKELQNISVTVLKNLK